MNFANLTLMATDIFLSALKKFPPAQQRALLATLASAEALFPHAVRDIAWGMPTLKIGQDNLCHVMGFKAHNSLFPASGAIAASMGKDLEKYVVSKGTIHFDLDNPFPRPLLKEILLSRLEQINSSYPKKSGEYIQYFSNGQLRIKGKYLRGNESGTWQWFFSNGEIKREGRYKNGEPSGLWRTYCPVTGDVKTEKIY